MVSPCTETGQETGSQLCDVNQPVPVTPEQLAHFFTGVTPEEHQACCPVPQHASTVSFSDTHTQKNQSTQPGLRYTGPPQFPLLPGFLQHREITLSGDRFLAQGDPRPGCADYTWIGKGWEGFGSQLRDLWLSICSNFTNA